jgi:hypothetical protein
LRSGEPPKYVRAPTASKLDSFREWICEQLQADPKIPSQRLREMAIELGYEGGKTIFDDWVREVRPAICRGARSSARSIGRVSWCSAICGSPKSMSRSGTGRRVAAMS